MSGEDMQWAENESKAYMGFFLITCLALSVFSHTRLGSRWILFVPIGLVVSSVVGGLFSVVASLLHIKGVVFLPSLLRIAGLGSVIGLTLYAYRTLGI